MKITKKQALQIGVKFGITDKIAIAHLLEFPDYYKRLFKLEEKADKYWKNKTKKNIFLDK